MAIKLCPCGKEIPHIWRLCRECYDIYGPDMCEWPEWLRWQVADIQRELDDDRQSAGFFYDTEQDKVVSQRRNSLVEVYDKQGNVKLRGCCDPDCD